MVRPSYFPHVKLNTLRFNKLDSERLSWQGLKLNTNKKNSIAAQQGVALYFNYQSLPQLRRLLSSKNALLKAIVASDVEKCPEKDDRKYFFDLFDGKLSVSKFSREIANYLAAGINVLLGMPSFYEKLG